mgnify:FL=1
MKGNESKLFRVSKDNSENIKIYANRIGKTESYVINKALRRYFSNQPAVEKLSEPVMIGLSKSMLAFFEQEKNKYGHSGIRDSIMYYLYIGLKCASDYEEFKMEFESMEKQRIYDFWQKMDDEETCRKFNLTMQELKDILKEFGV